MKVKIEFEANDPGTCGVALSEVLEWLYREHKPRRWVKIGTSEVLADTGDGDVTRVIVILET